ncbi:hypothetical protein GA830_12070 [Mesorhizobium sp. NBSH29]|uniref:hypothetical protein n=1 Tax=Mesorhizobium sp. NBSH29 TaxID=2654249 RepID=UPI0018963EB7|nr:hypothetical protein [Mesorhizobium sp. NBSH29]QPC87394.1 hypothetical protein GA830_12070 [Mesorhizobium sp. NBSH29]
MNATWNTDEITLLRDAWNTQGPLQARLCPLRGGMNKVPMTLTLPPQAHKRLAAEALQRGYKPTVFAQMLFDAAFAARISMNEGSGDRDLDEMVRATLCLAGDFSTDTIARRLRLSEPLVVKILDGWRQQGRQLKPKAAGA